jgi:hypothetical protein
VVKIYVKIFWRCQNIDPGLVMINWNPRIYGGVTLILAE